MRALLPLLLSACLLACRSSASRSDGLPEEARARSASVDVGPVRLHTVTVGPERGPLRLVLHGGPGLDHTYLRPWLDPLGRERTLVYADLRGHGRSGVPPTSEDYTLALASGDLDRWIELRAQGQPVDLLAHDFGAAVALELASRHPEHVRRVVLLAPLSEASQLRVVARRSREALGEAGWARVQELSTPQGTLRDPRTFSELARRLGVLWWARPPSEAVLSRLGRDLQYHAAADEAFLAELTHWDGPRVASLVRAPTLVLTGAADRTFLPSEARALASRLAHGRFTQVEGAGHLPFIEAPAQTLAEIEAFLRP